MHYHVPMHRGDHRGMVTSEYAVGTVAAISVAGWLVLIAPQVFQQRLLDIFGAVLHFVWHGGFPLDDVLPLVGAL